MWEWDKYRLPEKNFDLSVFYYQCGMSYLKNLHKIRCSNIIDAGAYIGDSSVVLSYYTDCNVYAFEAFRKNYDQIKEVSQLNNRNNIVPVNKALGKDESEKTFYIRTYTDTGHGVVKREGMEYKEEIHVETVSIDSFVEKNGLQVGLIKSDIEGAEQELLEGAKKTICSQKPALLISIYHTAEDFFMIKRKIEEMQLGYSFRIFHPICKSSIVLETVLVCEAFEDSV